MNTKKFTVLDLLDLDLKEKDDLKLKCISGRSGLTRTISIPNINRPGLALSGFFDNFAFERIQVFGRGEQSYLDMLARKGEMDSIKEFFEFPIPCCIVTSGMQPNEQFLQIAHEAGVPILTTSFNSSEFIIKLMRVLSDVFAPRIIVHGTLVEVYGIGILLKGGSGIGKSETALELIERGHRLIADDAVELSCSDSSIIIGRGANKVTGFHMEIRGLGIINVSHLFGVGAIRDKKKLELIVNLEEWDPQKNYDRFGGQDKYEEILGVQIPVVDIPVKTGRTIPVIVETASMNQRLKKMGYFSAKEFNENMLQWLENENARALYYKENDTF